MREAGAAAMSGAPSSSSSTVRSSIWPGQVQQLIWKFIEEQAVQVAMAGAGTAANALGKCVFPFKVLTTKTRSKHSS
jgi:hypothetical protein